MSEYILKAQQIGNQITGFGIVEDGIDGPETQKMINGVFQWAMNQDYGAGLEVDGIWGPASAAAISGHYVEYGETQYMVAALEIGLMGHGYNAGGIEQPGTFGDGLRQAVITFQNEHGLVADGIAGAATFNAIIGTSGTGGGGGHGVPLAPYDPNNLPNFGPDEFKCVNGCGGDVCDELKIRAQMLRDKIGKPMTITCGFRCPPENERQGGVPDSLHMYGKAFDYQVYHDGTYKMTPSMLEEYREYAHQVGLDCGLYYSTGFMHCDLSGTGDFIGD